MKVPFLMQIMVIFQIVVNILIRAFIMLRLQIDSGNVEIVHLNTEIQVSNVLTKSLSREKFERHRKSFV